ncbi:MAG: polysaccharide pyruvyl transferase CsaB [Oscillospiraceae bacterium]|nr:polysaccharide pyruvyl transferase CsaB [Oscillospiraceae bacterium]
MACKILMVTMGLDIGGAETHIVELSKQLKVMGHDVAVVSNGGVYVPEIEKAGIRHYQAPLNRRSAGCMLRSLRILKQVIWQEQPDVVHAHARIPGFLCGLLHKHMGFPFVTTAHWVFQTSGGLRYLTNWGQRTIAVSDDIKAYLMREYGIPAEHISVTINGIDTDKFSPEVSGARVLAEFGLDPERPIVSYVSRMDEDRALVARQLIEIAPSLEQHVPGVQLLIAGGGNVFDELNKKADQINRQLGRKVITMTGPRTDINEIVAAGDVFVGVSRAALEAMAAAKPVIVAGNEGYQGLFGPDKLEEARLGNFCCRGLELSTPERLLDDVSTALCMPAERAQGVGAYGRQVIFDYYSVRRMAQDCLDMYETVRRKAYRVLMSGYYGFSNAGDDAILQSIHDNLTHASGEISVTVLSNDPEQTKERYGLDAVPRFHLLQVWGAVRRCDVLLSGGGSLLQDRTSTRSLLYYLSVMWLARLHGKKVMLYANGIGPVARSANRRRVKRAVERADLVTLRDHSSAKELRDMGVERTDLHITADPVFTMEPETEDRVGQILAQAGINKDKHFAVISVRSWPGTGTFAQELAAVCDHLYEAHGLASVFVLMQPGHDRDISRKVCEEMKNPAILLDQSLTPKELMGVISRSRLCLAMRLHTLIFAARAAVPVVGLVYDPKVSSYLEELDMPCAGEVERFDRAQAITCVDQLMADYEARRAALCQRSCQLTQAAGKNERLLLELLSKD